MLDGYKAGLSLMLRASIADPGHPTEVSAGRVFTAYKFDYLPAPNVETSAYPETLQRKIEDEAAECLWLAVQVDPQAGTFFQPHVL